MPKLGVQPAPTPGVHNSQWIQSPGKDGLSNPARLSGLEKYVKDVVGTFAQDARILGWDVWNEPDNDNAGSYGSIELVNKTAYVNFLLPQVFDWARSVNPSQPLTSGVWKGGYLNGRFDATEQIQVDNSDVISFHDYSDAKTFAAKVDVLRKTQGRAIVCTEYMARPMGSTFVAILPVALNLSIGVMNWGFVQGKTQTYLPWDR
jgi:hypothetical protein